MKIVDQESGGDIFCFSYHLYFDMFDSVFEWDFVYKISK